MRKQRKAQCLYPFSGGVDLEFDIVASDVDGHWTWCDILGLDNLPRPPLNAMGTKSAVRPLSQKELAELDRILAQ